MAPLVYVSAAPANVYPDEKFDISVNCAVKDLNTATLWLEVTPGVHRNANAGPAQEQYPPEYEVNNCTDTNVLMGSKVATGADGDGQPYTKTFTFRNLYFKESAKGYLWTLFFTLMNDGEATGHGLMGPSTKHGG